MKWKRRICYLNSAAKTVINYKDSLHKSFQEFLHRLDHLINKGSAWTIKY